MQAKFLSSYKGLWVPGIKCHRLSWCLCLRSVSPVWLTHCLRWPLPVCAPSVKLLFDKVKSVLLRLLSLQTLLLGSEVVPARLLQPSSAPLAISSLVVPCISAVMEWNMDRFPSVRHFPTDVTVHQGHKTQNIKYTHRDNEDEERGKGVWLLVDEVCSSSRSHVVCAWVCERLIKLVYLSERLWRDSFSDDGKKEKEGQKGRVLM